MTKTKSSEMCDHALHKVLPREARECQSALQWGYGERNERCVGHALPFTCGKDAVEFEVLEVWEETDEVQDLSVRTVGLFKGKEAKRG